MSRELEHNAVAWLLGFLVSPASEHVVWRHSHHIKWESLTLVGFNAFNVHCSLFQLGTFDFQIQTELLHLGVHDLVHASSYRKSGDQWS